MAVGIIDRHRANRWYKQTGYLRSPVIKFIYALKLILNIIICARSAVVRLLVPFIIERKCTTPVSIDFDSKSRLYKIIIIHHCARYRVSIYLSITSFFFHIIIYAARNCMDHSMFIGVLIACWDALPYDILWTLIIKDFWHGPGGLFYSLSNKGDLITNWMAYIVLIDMWNDEPFIFFSKFWFEFATIKID